MRSAPLWRLISTRTNVPHSDVNATPDAIIVGRRKLDAGAIDAFELAPPRRMARLSISAVHCSPATGKRARDQAQREKPCAIAPVTKLRAMRRRAQRRQGERHQPVDDELSRPSSAPWPNPWRADHSPRCATARSAAGHRPKRKITRAASAAACVATCAPIDALVAELIAATQRGFFLRGVLGLLVDGVGDRRR